MDIHNSKTIGILAALVAICGLSAAALMHRSNSTATPLTLGMAGTQSSDLNSAYVSPGATYAAGSQIATSGQDGYYSTTQRPVYVHQQERTIPLNQEQQYSSGPTTYSTDRRYRTRTVYEERPTYRHGRSKEHSVEIVAGTAGVGAVIGAIAGGGKGAAIGAASGAGAGFAYDRLTHNH